jgi:hypothetical protein
VLSVTPRVGAEKEHLLGANPIPQPLREASQNYGVRGLS